ncbi:PIN domain-containing protein [Streptomyces sp. 351MFTsu5.1]|uniref:PIN domain-containing protein n=1 Tax=Streptomyces sp. 351MFTsu5.1 TaxID=1172180 RepID=UPI001319D078|nr:PIN domain-containing protein [Streptomyces sp. 351MFTsu5.1]
MLRLLIDTSVWLDIARRRDGQQIIVPIRVLFFQKKLDLLVPSIILEEFERNRPRAEAAATDSVRERFRLLKQDLKEYGDSETQEWIAEMAHQVPFVSAQALQNFSEISELLGHGKKLEPSAKEKGAVVERALEKRAPFHLNKNSIADALLMELFRSALAESEDSSDCYVFATSNYQDFSVVNGDRRKPHPDFDAVFADGRTAYAYDVDGLIAVLAEQLGEEYEELVEEVSFLDDPPRSLAEILELHTELYDRIWYTHSRWSDTPDGHINPRYDEGLRKSIEQGRARIEGKYDAGLLLPADDYEWGFLNGKMAILEWLLGDDLNTAEWYRY